MKLSEIKHNHSLTDLLKVFIFSILMLLPFLSVLTRCMYVTFNKNAYQSYSGTSTYETYSIQYEYETNEVNSENDLIEGNIYKFNFDKSLVENSQTLITVTGVHLLQNDVGYTSFRLNQPQPLVYYPPTESVVIFFNNQSYNTISYINSNYIDCYVVYYNIRSNLVTYENFSESDYLGQENVIIETHESSTLDNVFEYSFQRMSQDDMFNWTQNTALYSGIHAMTNNLQIQTNVIAILLTYWTILTIVYVIIDIVLKCFTLLTHGFSRKSS